MLSNIKAKNFMSWKDLDFNITKGATLVDGWNQDDGRSEGSGKSAVLNSVCWAIFGKLPKDANVDEVIKDGATSCSVILEFDNGDKIVRSRKPNDLALIKGGVTVKGKDARETQSFLEEYVGCNFETFCQSVYFAQNYDKKFLSSNQEDKGKILSSIQNLQIFDKARKEVMDLLNLEEKKNTKLKTEVQLQENNLNNLITQHALIKSFIEDKIQKHQAQLSMLSQQRDLISGHIKKTTNDLETINQRILSIDLNVLSQDENELNQAKTEYATQLSGITYQKSQLDSIKKSIQAKEAEGKSLASKYESLDQKIKSLNPTGSHRYKSLQANRDQVLNLGSNQSRNRLIAKVTQLEDFIANPSKFCPSCGTELGNADTSHAETELASVLKEIDELTAIAQKQAIDYETQMNEEVIAVRKQSEELAAEAVSVMSQLQAVSEYLDKNMIPDIGHLNQQEQDLKNVISQIDSAIFQTNQKKLEHSTLMSQYQSLNNQFVSYTQQHGNYELQISNLGTPNVEEDTKKLDLVANEYSVASVKVAELNGLLETSKEYSVRLETLKDGFKEIKSYVFTNALNELNFRTNQYLNDLFEMEATIKFTTEDQKIESKIVLDGKVRSLGLLSGGQNRRFNLAVDLALSDIVSYRKTSKLDLLIFDEYFKDLSEISMEKSLDLLKSRKCPVILIEHNSLFKNIVENTFFVRLENGTSYESRQ